MSARRNLCAFVHNADTPIRGQADARHSTAGETGFGQSVHNG